MIRWKDKSRGIPESPSETQTKAAFETLKQALHDDPGYAWSWHCNIAMSAQDEGVDYATANRAANRFMQLCFGVDTKEPVAA